ncbi:C4-dicarboxylate transporter/malic acid transport protein-like protein [Lophiostoma macrostomum CBS 122681]|uniref:C4-dicarboxylate transporter/malic acid transport protein-like protein n=1 Tax=Lophiostoma macrostomum CBS 122681 TaxID=1314788 RepID=A0A6A6SLV7_9PLEO|nr:C4-dicarboxylate transporter/malic acid transport protein-like protein [Lophiostoma macrostomum CBS 122681]
MRHNAHQHLNRHLYGDRQSLPWHKRLNHFTWSWFECTMSTGAIATLLGQQPYTFTGLKTIGKIFFILDLVLFLVFSGCIAYRFIKNRGTLTRSLHHPYESFYFGTFWVSIALILYCIQQYGVPSSGPWLVKTLEILFWTYAACVLLVAVFQYHVIFDEENLPVMEAMPAWILPVYPFLVLGPLAAVLLYSQPQDRGLRILIGGITFQGLGWCVAFIMYTIYVTRLVNSELPEPGKRPGMYVAVGPAAYTANTLVALGVQAPKYIPPEFLGITSIPVGDIWKAIGVPAGIFLWLLAFWFSALSTVSVAKSARDMSFSLNWWAFVFPNAGLTIALIQIANVLASPAIKAVTSAMTAILVILWLVVTFMHIKAVLKGEVLWPGMDEDLEDAEGHPQEEDGEA